jgi:hypothetical protein
MDMLGERNQAEDRVDIHNGDTVLAIDHKSDYLDALHDRGELGEPLPKRSSSAIRIRWELADYLRMKRSGGRVITPQGINYVSTT